MNEFQRTDENDFSLVLFWAGKLAPKLPFLELGDIVGSGSIGLLRAKKSFDPAKGKFSVWAGIKIRGEIFQFARSQSGQWDRNIGRIEFARDMELIELNPNPERLVLLREVFRMVERLRPNLRQAIILRYWADMSTVEIGEILGVSQSRISQILPLAIEGLRGFYGEKNSVLVSGDIRACAGGRLRKPPTSL